MTHIVRGLAGQPMEITSPLVVYRGRKRIAVQLDANGIPDIQLDPERDALKMNGYEIELDGRGIPVRAGAAMPTAPVYAGTATVASPAVSTPAPAQPPPQRPDTIALTAEEIRIGKLLGVSEERLLEQKRTDLARR